MATFRYEAVDRNGVVRTGTVGAGTIRQAIDDISAWGLYVRRVEPLFGEDAAPTGEQPLEVTTFLPPLSEPAAENVAGLLSEAIGGGLPLEPALRAAAEDATASERRVLNRIADDIARGTPPGEAFTKVGDALPSHLLALILAGLEGGDLARLLGRYLTLSRQRSETRRLVWLGLAYPLVLLCGVSMLTVAALILIVPQFESLIRDFGIKVPLVTQLVFGMSRFMMTIWGPAILVALFVGATFILYWAVMRRRGMKVSAVDFFIRSADWSRFCGLLGLLIEGRQPLPQALRLTAASAGTMRVKTAGLRMADDVAAGLTPWEAALPQRMPAAIRQAFRWAHRPEVFAEALAGLAELYSRRSRITASMVGVFVEPFVLFGVASTVGFIVLAIFLPLIQLLNDLA